MHASRQSRGGFTLIELLVVIALMAILAALTIRFMPNAASSAREARAGTVLQGWLSIAKQRALRDQAPRGVRLWILAGTMQVVECQYLETPDDFTGGQIYTMNNAAPYDTIAFSGASDLLNGYTTAASDQQYWLVQPGDYLEVMGTGLMRRITTPVVGSAIKITPPLPYGIGPVSGGTMTSNYRIVRAPRAVGDETLKMPEGTVIELATNGPINGPLNPLPITYDPITGLPVYLDILFAPTGTVITRSMTSANLHLWVRAPDLTVPNDFYKGNPTIISIFTRTGFAGAYDPSTSANPYLNVY